MFPSPITGGMFVTKGLELAGIQKDTALSWLNCGTRWVRFHLKKKFRTAGASDMKCSKTALVAALYASSHLLLTNVTTLDEEK